jgi:hypothetical protein
MYVSEYLKLSVKGHSNFDFVDVFLNDDNRLFIDPYLIERSTDDWSQQALIAINTFFDKLFEELKSGNMLTSGLFDHAHEQNATKLGYGNGHNGKGKTPDGLMESLKKLCILVEEIPTISRAQDIPVLVEGFAEDCMSDLLTNILYEKLWLFTAQQMKKYGREADDYSVFVAWDIGKCKWVKFEHPCWLHNGREILLVPKWIIRKNYLFNVHQYLMRIIIERMKNEEGKRDLSKKSIRANIARSSEHWEYEEVIEYTKEHPDALEEYHFRLPQFYNQAGGCMTEGELDEVIYNRRVIQSA